MIEYRGFPEVYEDSINEGDLTVFMARDDSGDFLVFIEKGETRKVPLNHESAEILRKLFPFTRPSRVLGKERSFGTGDRLGIATPGHAKLFKKYDAYPVFAQQSMRELNLTNRSYSDVLDAASFAVFREGFKKEWGADGDHLKKAEDIRDALSLGYTMITLDCSEHIKNDITESNAPPLPQHYVDKYLGKKFDAGEGLVLSFNEDELRKTAAIYGEAISFAAGIFKEFFDDGKYDADFEISIDETLTPTTPLQHFFTAKELIDAGVALNTLAPRFCGDFQKGIDYIGDIKQFESEIKAHAIIARHFGYKLSIHSGSDKFAVFPLIAQATGGSFHVKTAGTNWLEAMRVIAAKDPALYREVHKYALASFEEACKYYTVSCDLSKIRDIDTLKDEELPGLFDLDDSRQLTHITYGLILSKRNETASSSYRDRLYRVLRENSEEYALALEKHIGRHLDLLGVKKL